MFGPGVPPARKALDTPAILKGGARKTGITLATRKKTKQSQFLATNLKSMAYVLFSAPLFGVRLVLTVFSRTSPPPRGERRASRLAARRSRRAEVCTAPNSFSRSGDQCMPLGTVSRGTRPAPAIMEPLHWFTRHGTSPALGPHRHGWLGA